MPPHGPSRPVARIDFKGRRMCMARSAMSQRWVREIGSCGEWQWLESITSNQNWIKKKKHGFSWSSTEISMVFGLPSGTLRVSTQRLGLQLLRDFQEQRGRADIFIYSRRAQRCRGFRVRRGHRLRCTMGNRHRAAGGAREPRHRRQCGGHWRCHQGLWPVR